jgi:hypothetical protein
LSIRGLILSPSTWLRGLELQKSSAREILRTEHPLPALAGTVDIVPSAQSIVLANGLRYHPRFTIQEYHTFTLDLISRNREFFSSETAPDFLLFSPGSIDHRHPALAEGPLWPLFLANYMPIGLAGDMLVMEHRRTQLPVGFGTGRRIAARFGQYVNIPNENSIWFVKIRVNRSIIGLLANVLFKLPPLFMSVDYQDGHSEQYRIIREIAGEGFFVSPLVRTATDYLSIATKDGTTRPGQRALRMSVWTDFSTFYRPDIDIELLPLDIRNLPLSSELSSSVEGLISRMNVFNELIPEKTFDQISLISDGLFAHPPSILRLSVKGAHALFLEFGLLDTSWQGDAHTDGVCFQVSDRTDRVSWERCLEPLTRVADRGIQSAQIPIPAETEEVLLKTECGENCNWDWSYWRTIERR